MPTISHLYILYQTNHFSILFGVIRSFLLSIPLYPYITEVAETQHESRGGNDKPEVEIRLRFEVKNEVNVIRAVGIFHAYVYSTYFSWVNFERV